MYVLAVKINMSYFLYLLGRTHVITSRNSANLRGGSIKEDQNVSAYLFEVFKYENLSMKPSLSN